MLGGLSNVGAAVGILVLVLLRIIFVCACVWTRVLGNL
jgi:hypothetical protein